MSENTPSSGMNHKETMGILGTMRMIESRMHRFEDNSPRSVSV